MAIRLYFYDSSMAVDILLVVLGVCFLLGGLAGCILPIVPGPPLSYIALLFLQATRFGEFSVKFLIITAVIMIVITIVDYLLPVWGTKKWGGSKAGAVGAIIGLLAGLFFPPFGIIVGPFGGAVAGEMIAGRDTKTALRSGLGSFIGFLFGTGMKLAVCIVFTYYFAMEIFI